MAQGPVDLVVFDMAGTTIVDHGEVLSAFTTALERHGVTADPSEVRQRMGQSKREAIAALLGPGQAGQVDQVYATFREVLESTYAARGVTAMPGAEETFAWLRQRGIKIATTTGFYARVAGLLLEAVGWRGGKLDATLCSDDVPQGRPAPYLIFRCMERTGVTDVRRVAAVGDTPMDLRAGSNAGCGLVIGVLSGEHDATSMGRWAHTHLLPSVADLPGLLEGLGA